MTQPKATTKSRSARNAKPKTGLSAGDTVTNPLKPEWGPGKVIDLQGKLVFVFFRDRPDPEVIRMRESGLVPAEADPTLDALPNFTARSGGFNVPAAARRAAAKRK